MTEQWQKIPGFTSYEVSSSGRVRSYKNSENGKPAMMKIMLGQDNYPRVTLQSDRGNKTVCRVHILVARTFIGPARGRLVLHKNGKTTDPRLVNLRYGTYLANHKDKYKHGTHGKGEKNSRALINRRQAREIYRLKGRMTQQKVAEKYGISRQAVSDIQRGVTWNEVTKARPPKKRPKKSKQRKKKRSS